MIAGLKIKGIEKLSMVDYPGKPCTTLFLGGCNFRCGFCHNADLVLRPGRLPSIPVEEAIEKISSWKKWIDGVCITGGEPLLYRGIIDLAARIKAMGLAVKVDTNGSRPGLLKELIQSGKVDYVAMDVKGTLEKYSLIAGVQVNTGRICESIELLRQGLVEYEFRITAVPGEVDESDFLSLSNLLEGARRFRIQRFRPSDNMISPSFKGRKPFSEKQLENFQRILKNKITDVSLRN